MLKGCPTDPRILTLGRRSPRSSRAREPSRLCFGHPGMPGPSPGEGGSNQAPPASPQPQRGLPGPPPPSGGLPTASARPRSAPGLRLAPLPLPPPAAAPPSSSPSRRGGRGWEPPPRVTSPPRLSLTSLHGVLPAHRPSVASQNPPPPLPPAWRGRRRRGCARRRRAAAPSGGQWRRAGGCAGRGGGRGEGQLQGPLSPSSQCTAARRGRLYRAGAVLGVPGKAWGRTELP